MKRYDSVEEEIAAQEELDAADELEFERSLAVDLEIRAAVAVIAEKFKSAGYEVETTGKSFSSRYLHIADPDDEYLFTVRVSDHSAPKGRGGMTENEGAHIAADYSIVVPRD